MMDSSPLLTAAMVLMMVVMMGGMIAGAGWAFLRQRRQHAKRRTHEDSGRSASL
jgi:hypothetical protein